MCQTHRQRNSNLSSPKKGLHAVAEHTDGIRNVADIPHITNFSDRQTSPKNEKQMSKHINNIFNDVSSWWNNSRVKKCKSNFEKKYSQRPIKNALSFLANEIEKVI